MRTARIIVLALLGFSVLCAIQREARVEHMCVRPSPTLVSGHEEWPSMCPESHPHAFGGRVWGTGAKCCKTHPSQPPDPLVAVCPHQNYTACPGMHPCMSYDKNATCSTSDGAVHP